MYSNYIVNVLEVGSLTYEQVTLTLMNKRQIQNHLTDTLSTSRELEREDTLQSMTRDTRHDETVSLSVGHKAFGTL
jgi:hypothetical protein